MSAPHSFGPGCEECEGYCLELAKLARECGGIRGGSFDAVKTWEFTEEGLTKFATRLSAPRIPPGYALVPVEPTTAMLAAAIAAYTWHAAGLNRINADRKAYAALLQHAPAPPLASLPGEGGEAELLDVLSLLQRARLYTNTTPAQCERGPFAVFRSELDAAIVKLGGDL
jgi:hypothetical protein